MPTCVGALIAADGVTPVPAGFYVVASGDRAVKLVVR